MHKEHEGEVMIFDLCISLQEVLEDEVRQILESRKIPSLKEERAVQEAILNEEAKRKEELEKQKSRVSKAEEERVLRQKVDEELYRRKQSNRRSKNQSISKPMSSSKGRDSVFNLVPFLIQSDSSVWGLRLIVN